MLKLSHRSLRYAVSSTSESDTEKVLEGIKANQDGENIVNREYKSSDYDETNADNLKSPDQLSKQPTMKEAKKIKDIEAELLKERDELMSKVKSFGIQSVPEAQDLKKIVSDNDVDTDVNAVKEILEVKGKAKKAETQTR